MFVYHAITLTVLAQHRDIVNTDKEKKLHISRPLALPYSTFFPEPLLSQGRELRRKQFLRSNEVREAVLKVIEVHV